MGDYSYYEEVARNLLARTKLPFVKDRSVEVSIKRVVEKNGVSLAKGILERDTGEASFFPCCESYIEKLGKFTLTEDDSTQDGSDIKLEFKLKGSDDRHIVTYWRGDNGSESCSYSIFVRRGFHREIQTVF